MALARQLDGAHARVSIPHVYGDRAGIVTSNDLVSEVGW